MAKWILAFFGAIVAGSSPGTVIFSSGAWAAVDRGPVCEALTRSLRIATKDKVQAVAGVSFTSDHRRWAEFHVRLSKLPRGDASVMLEVGGQPFLLVSSGGWAWSSGRLQGQAIVAAMRESKAMDIASRDSTGLRFSDPYLLDGAPTAIDAAAARCALRGAGKIR